MKCEVKNPIISRFERLRREVFLYSEQQQGEVVKQLRWLDKYKELRRTKDE